PKGYKKGYRVTAGFLLWLEADRAPGIVKKLNTAMRGENYSEKLFKQESGRSLDELWSEYTGL
ncbi:MAG: basic secretory protein-like protein, partial [Planctomycetota bacterium]